MNKLKIGHSFICFVMGLYSVITFSSELDTKLDALNIPSDKITPLLSNDDLVSVTGRYSSLNKRNEITLKGAHNFSSDSHIQTRQVGVGLRRHINSKWSFGINYTEYENSLTSAGKKLFDDQRILPDTDYAIKSVDGLISYNTVYGKIRLTEKQIVYFDHFLAVGYGHIDLASGQNQLYTLDTGFVFWVGKNASLRFGVKSEFYRQKKLQESKNAVNTMGHVEIGYLL